MRKKLLVIFFLGLSSLVYGQMGIGTLHPNESAELEVKSADKGILIPRIKLKSLADQTTITNGNVESLLVYNTTDNTSLDPGYYYWHNQQWVRLGSAALPNNIVIWDSINHQFTYIDQQGGVQVISVPSTQEHITTLKLLNGKILQYINEAKDTTRIDLTTVMQGGKTISLINGLNTKVDSLITPNHVTYKVNVPTAKGARNGNPPTLGVVKEADSMPTVLINQQGELSVNTAHLNPVKVVHRDYRAQLDDKIIIAEPTHGNLTITLPNPVGNKGKRFLIRKDDSNENYYVRVAGNIVGVSGILYTAVPYTGWGFVSDGSRWRIVNKL